MVSEPAERRRGQKGHVAREKDERSLPPREVSFRLLKRVRGSLLRFLKRELQVEPVTQPFADGVGAVADDERHGGGSDRLRRPNDMLNHRPSSDRMQHFWQAGLHPGSLAGGKDNDVGVSGHQQLTGSRAEGVVQETHQIERHFKKGDILLYDQFSDAFDGCIDLFRRSPVLLSDLIDDCSSRHPAIIGYVPKYSRYIIVRN